MATDASFFLRRDTGLNTWSPQFIADPGVDALFYLVNSTGLFAAMNLPIAATFGGTGFDSYAVGDLLYASTTTALSKLPDIATGNALISGGTGVAPSWGKIGLTTHVSGILPAPNGGTGQSSYAVGDLLYANTTTTLAKLADTATGNALLAGGIGVAPAWGKVTPSHFSGVLLVANGGTGLSTIASGKLLYASALDTLTELSIGTSLAITAATLDAIQDIRTTASPTFIGATLNTNGIGVTPTTRLDVTNATAAAAGAQQWSGALHFGAQGWKTALGGASRSVDFRNYLQSVQGLALPDGRLVWESSINGSAYAERMALTPIGLSITGVFQTTSTIQCAGLSMLGAGAGTLVLTTNEVLTLSRNLNFIVNDASRILTISGDATIDNWFNQNVKTSASPTFAGLTSPIGQVTPNAGSFTSLRSVVPDSTYGCRISGASGTFRFLGYLGGTAYMDAVDISESTAINLNIAGATVVFGAGGVNVLTVTSTGMSITGAIVGSGAITTGGPSGGSAAAWKLGGYTAGTVTHTGTVRVEIAGVAYDLLVKL